ncbi:glycosyltransferase [Longimicrobium sp.]|uniref:glycosyltransferase n=1 Tax=Longimicrobium sp. TaxID=2029185 RepID=UPI002CBB77C7|nr:glycosyltransferase [Longimicrobium sp.]HSU18050.1 glycosyltransferase [Longimicrobium sp.]
MKVLYLVTAYARDPADVITPWLVETIRRLAARGVAVEVLAPAYRGLASQTIDGVRVHRFRYAPRGWETLTHDQTAPDRIRERPWFLGLVPGYVAAGSRAAAKLARDGGFDVVHAFWPIPQGLLGLHAKRRSGLPLVSTFFGVELTWMERQFPFLAPLLRRIVRGSDAVTAISTYTADRLRKQVPGVDPAIIPFGAAVDAPAEPPPYTYDGARAFELLFVGRLVERKGVHLLLDALASLPAERRALLHVVGDGPDRAKLEEQARRLELGGRAIFHGFVSKEELQRRLETCDAFVLPAVVDAKGDTEGLGVVLIEAMSYARPVIASAAGGIVDIVRDRRNGLLVPPGDAPALAAAIAGMMDDPARAREFGLNGREDVAANFSWDVIADRLAEIYRDVSRRRPRRGA